MWKYRDLRGLENATVKVPPLWRGRSWWLWATPKQCHDAAALIEKAREETNYYAVYTNTGDPVKDGSDVAWTVVGFFFFAWMLWVVLEWISPMEEPDDENPNRPGFFCVSGVCMLIKLACYGADFSAQAVARTPIGGNFQVEFFLSWLILWSTHIANAMLVLACIHGCKSFWESIFGDRPAFNGPDTVLFLATILGVFGTFESLESNGMSEAEQAMVARARRHTRSAWYNEGDLGYSFKDQVQDDFWDDVDERVSEIWENAAAIQPCKLTKAQRKALGKEREARREAERLAQKKRDRQEAKEQKARAREMQAATIRRAVERAGLPSDAPFAERERPLHLTREQVLEARYTRALAGAELARRRLEEFEDEYEERMALLDEEKAAIQGRLEAPDSGSGSGSDEGLGDGGPSHSDHVDAADLALQTQRNKEEAERQRRVREQREKEKAEQKEKEYSEAGPSHKEGAPRWVEEPPDEGDKAKREAEKQASLLRKQQQQRERVKEKEAREKRESERLQSLKTGRRILQGNAHDRAPSNNNNVQRSSLQPLREDEPAPTLTLADVSLQFQEDPRFQPARDDDLESVATTAVPTMLTHHAEERKEERNVNEHEIKRTKKYGRVKPGNKPGTLVHHPCQEGDPKLVTDSFGTVLTVIK